MNKLQETIRSEFGNISHTLELKIVDLTRKELQSVIGTEMKKLEPVLNGTALQLLTQLSQDQAIIDKYSAATSAAALTAMNQACKEMVVQQLMPKVDRSLHHLFCQLHDAFSKRIVECECMFILLKVFYHRETLYPVVRDIEGNMERHRQFQDKVSLDKLAAAMEKMTGVLGQVQKSIVADTKLELGMISDK